ncbi:tRNA(Ile)-lysidine synthase [Desulfovibrio sp. X2]|uniref:tRNA lysidine(34) synthetase TilS n=1 Tax=Desulfovibrio sp. X2 TaxID=941449 RepID=UPI000358E513|nr:tRNA lysidine(34) synthetase TilS [Desulfovibrio sp. X2]EPR42320.1 tRNA(Ile)-lysidine synthase [Desulfovibrio sp. X2]
MASPRILPDTLPHTLQDLPPAQAHLCLDVQRFVSRELGVELAGRSLLVAFSGGADSTALLLAFHYLAPRLSARIAAAHLDHGLRPESADDAAHCRAFCAALGIPYFGEREDVAELSRRKGMGLEEAGRIARRDFLQRVILETGADWVLFGHHLNDLAEDQLMRLMRGTGWPELGGMAGVDVDRSLLRPFLLTPRARLREFLQAAGVPWREDASNQDPAFLRNRVRHDVLPLFVRENPNYLTAAARLWNLARLDRELAAASLSEPEPGLGLGEEPDTLVLRAEVLDAAHPAVRLRLCKQALTRLGPGQPLMDGLMDLEHAWTARRIGAAVRFPGDKEARVAPEGIVFGRVRRFVS